MNGYDIPQCLLIALLFIYCAGNGIGLIMRLILARRVKRMTHAIQNRVACNGHLVPPDDIKPGAYNVGGGFPEYIFIEERNDKFGERMIFISKDCKHIHVMPWRDPVDIP